MSWCPGPLLHLGPGAPIEVGTRGKLPQLPLLWAGLYTGKRIRVSCILDVKANSALLCKYGRKSSNISLKVAQDNRKISFHSLFITASNKNCLTTGYFCCHSNKQERFLRNLSSPNSKYSDAFPDSYLSGFVSNPETFYSGFAD